MQTKSSNLVQSLGSVVRTSSADSSSPSEDEKPLLPVTDGFNHAQPSSAAHSSISILTERSNGLSVRVEKEGVKNGGGMVAIEIEEGASSDQSSSPSTNKFPKEPQKLLLAIVMMFFAALSNDLVLAYIHEKIPNTPPLPDIFFANTTQLPWTLPASEYLILCALVITIILGFLHRHRWIVFRRIFFISSLLYYGRAVSMFVTQVPVADPTYYCAPKLNRTDFPLLMMRALSLVSGVGLGINGKHTLCGDYIYSGHTLVLVMAYLVFREYSPKRWWPLHWLVWLGSLVGVFFLLLSRGHYSLDVIIAYWVCTRLFWVYHTMCANPSLKESSSTNQISKVIWFPLFQYMEGNVIGVVPKRFEWPLPWPRSLRRNSKSNLH